MANRSKCNLCGAQSFEITPQVVETRLRIAALEAECARLREDVLSGQQAIVKAAYFLRGSTAPDTLKALNILNATRREKQ